MLREFISKAKENEKELVNKIRKLKNVNFITKMSGAYTNKWKTLYSAWKKNLKFGQGSNQLTKAMSQIFKIIRLK